MPGLTVTTDGAPTRHRTDAQSAAEFGDGTASIVLALPLAAPQFAPRLATCRRSISNHGRCPGDETWVSGIHAILGSKDASAERLLRDSRQQLRNWKNGDRRVPEYIEMILLDEKKARKSAS
jgi:hypothetical protein